MTPAAITPADPAAVGILEEADRLAEMAQRRADVYERIRNIGIHATHPSDWTKMGDTFHCGEAGVTRIARICGVSMGPPRETKIELEPDLEHGTGYLYRVEREFCVGRFETASDIITEVGTASSRDPFFAERGRGDEKVYLPSWQVDEGNILKKAVTVCMVRGVTRLLGIRGVTLDQLQAAGIDVNRLKGVSFDGGSKGGRGQQNSATVSAEELEAIKAKRAEIRTAVLEMAEGDVDGAKAMLQALTAFKAKDGKDVAGVTSVDALNPPRLDIALKKVRDEHAEWAKGRPKEEANG